MTIISLADGCRLLAIDPKTLRRWLDLAHVPLLPHASDARIKGLASKGSLPSACARLRPPIVACWLISQRPHLPLFRPSCHKSRLRFLASSSMFSKPSQSSLPRSWSCSSA